jgi:hypothetical protein
MYHLKDAGEIYRRNICRIHTIFAETVRKQATIRKLSRKEEDALQYLLLGI